VKVEGEEGEWFEKTKEVRQGCPLSPLLRSWKTKMMMFSKRKKKSGENEWNWEGRKIEHIYTEHR
jgi:hypothetical protein